MSKNIGEKFDSWRELHKGSLESLYDAFAAGHVEGFATNYNRLSLCEDELAALRKACQVAADSAAKVIEMTFQTAQHQYGDRSKAEGWSCVVVLGEAPQALLAAGIKPGKK